jgi:hypothetical protein
MGPPRVLHCPPCVYSGILALDLDSWFRGQGINDEVIVAMRAVLIALVKLLGVLAKGLFAFLAGKGDLEAFEEGMAFRLFVAVGAIEPLAAWEKKKTAVSILLDIRHQTSAKVWWGMCGTRTRTTGGPDGDLGVEDVFTGRKSTTLLYRKKKREKTSTDHMAGLCLLLYGSSSMVPKVLVS